MQKKCKEETLSKNLFKVLSKKYQHQVNAIFDYEWCELAYNYLGFLKNYYYLSKMIPKHFTVIDLGCYAGFQSYYFRNHKKYIGVNCMGMYNTEIVYLRLPNSEYRTMDIMNFIKEYKNTNNNTVFAICNYVPLSDKKKKKVNSTFNNIFHFQPAC